MKLSIVRLSSGTLNSCIICRLRLKGGHRSIDPYIQIFSLSTVTALRLIYYIPLRLIIIPANVTFIVRLFVQHNERSVDTICYVIRLSIRLTCSVHTRETARWSNYNIQVRRVRNDPFPFFPDQSPVANWSRGRAICPTLTARRLINFSTGKGID